MTDRAIRELLDEMEYTRSRMQHSTKLYVTKDELTYLVELVNRDVFGAQPPTQGKGGSAEPNEASPLRREGGADKACLASPPAAPSMKVPSWADKPSTRIP